MFDSPRPVRTMAAASIVFGPLPGHPAAASLRRFAAILARPGLRRSALRSLALAAVALPVHAAHRATPAAAAHGSSHSASHHAPAAPATPHARSASVAHGNMTVLAAAHHGRHGAVLETAATRHGRNEPAAERATAHASHRLPNHPLTRRERAQQVAEEREEALANLRERAAQHSSPRTGRHEAALRQTARLEVPREALRPGGHASRVVDTDSAADAHVEDRVHAWYRARHPQSVEPKAAPAAEALNASRPDLSTAPRKATADDFAHAAAVQRKTIVAAHEQQVHQTTSDDDNADAETRIPSTAPTEREPAPFVHGSFDEEATPAADATANHAQRQLVAPVVRQTATAGEPGITLAPPQHVDLKHRGDGLSSAIAADQAAQASNASGNQKPIPVATAADSSPRAIRALAQQTAASPAPVLKLPAPASGAMRKEQPAVAVVESGARRRELDPAVVSGMAERTFDDDGVPATARTAVALSAPSAVAGLVPARTHALSDDSDSNVSPAALVSVNLFDRQGHLILVPPMKGSHEILVHQNQMALADGLARIQDDRDLLDLKQRKLLVTLPDEDSTYPDDRLPANRRYARPWTVRFLRDLAKAHYARFGTPLIVTSAARTVEFQRRLVRTNGNAAPPTGDVASPHLYGQAIDLGKGRMGLTELTWMRAYLTPVENDGKIDVEEEFQQSCFHISVYRRYLGLPAQHHTAPAGNAPVTLLTAKDQPAPDETRPADRKHHRISTAFLATGLR